MGDHDNQMPDFSAAQRRMWELVERYTNRVGYLRGTKAAGLDASSPVIDCSGWVGVLLTEAMRAQNSATGKDIFDVVDIGACVAWSDRIVLEIESRTPILLTGCEITAATSPDYATTRLNLATFAWPANFPRPLATHTLSHILLSPPAQT